MVCQRCERWDIEETLWKFSDGRIKKIVFWIYFENSKRRKSRQNIHDGPIWESQFPAVYYRLFHHHETLSITPNLIEEKKGSNMRQLTISGFAA